MLHMQPTREVTPSIPAISAEDAARLAQTAYGIEGRAELLPGECDRNFRLRSAGGDYIFKISPAEYDPQLLSLHVDALNHIARTAPHLPVPKLVQSNGQDVPRLDDGSYMRLMTWLEGIPVVKAESTSALLDRVGSFAAEVVMALQSFDHPYAGTDTAWNLTQAVSLRPDIAHIRDADRQALAQGALDALERAQPALVEIPVQFIHNDIHHHNLLVSPDDATQITGLIDFGDMMRVPRVVELAVAIAHQLYKIDNVAEAMKIMTQAFCRTCPLSPKEVQTLPALVAARLASREIMVARRLAQSGDAGSYDGTISQLGWGALRRLMLQDLDRLPARLVEARA